MASIWGETHDKQISEFGKLVEDIQTKHSTIFEGRVNSDNEEIPDKLRNHYLITYMHDGKIGIGFQKDTYVPKSIQDEVTMAFISIFSF